jgi:4-amino-4-deoxy-L-arabinose transferase-like glycosyltransferase
VIHPSLRRLPRDPGISNSDALQHYLIWLLSVVCVVVLFLNLGRADFFEPDEGRNAEKAREILLLNDWVTPHENFLPVLDKPMAFYWLVAFAYKMSGITEWSARLPSALFTLGCLLLVYRFARHWWGSWEAMWSVLILLTSAEFFLLARIVRSDMVLTFCIALALCSFYSAIHAENEKAKNLHCLLMYGGLAAGTLVKGLIGLIIPGMVFFVYLLLTHQWSILRGLHLLSGTLLFFVIVAPWYLWADARNPGYLRYYFWDDHVTRYLTDEFSRTRTWFYFFFVVAIGFLPWTFCLPFVAKDCWQKLDDKNMYVVLWAALPFLFFSGSNSKLPHYVLPIYPALAILVGQKIADLFKKTEPKKRWALYLPWSFAAGFILYLIIGGVWERFLPIPIRESVSDNFVYIGFSAALMVFMFGAFAYASLKGNGRNQRAAYLCSCGSIGLFFVLVGQFMVTESTSRSAKALAEAAAPFITRDSQIAVYDTHITGLIFYLRLDRPIWSVSSLRKTTLMGSPYVSTHQPNPAPGHGRVLFRFDEFVDAWKNTKRPILVFAKQKTIPRFESHLGEGTKELVRVDEHVMVSKR